MKDWFATTHWSVVLDAGGSSDSARRKALAEICQDYWYPLYAYARKRVGRVDEAQDLTQEFFARLLERDQLSAADPEMGKFRAFLITAFKRFLSNEFRRSRTEKRGGKTSTLSLDFRDGESRLQNEPVDQLTAERLYDQQWAITLINRVLGQLGKQMTAQGKGEVFDALCGLLAGGGPDDRYELAAKRLRLTAGAARAAVHRMRGRYREILRREVANTVADPSEIDDEIKDLFASLGE